MLSLVYSGFATVVVQPQNLIWAGWTAIISGVAVMTIVVLRTRYELITASDWPVTTVSFVSIRGNRRAERDSGTRQGRINRANTSIDAAPSNKLPVAK